MIGLGPVERDPRQPIVFVDATTVATEFGVCRRTINRMTASAARQ
jgi:hypothetical protein